MGKGLENVDDGIGSHGVFGFRDFHNCGGAVGKFDQAEGVNADLGLRTGGKDRGVGCLRCQHGCLVVFGAVDGWIGLIACLGRLFGYIAFRTGRSLLGSATAQTVFLGRVGGTCVCCGESWLHELDQCHETRKMLKAAEYDQQTLGRETGASILIVLLITGDGLAAMMRVNRSIVQTGAVTLGVNPKRQRRRDHGRYNGHQHKHGEDPRIQNTSRQTNVEHDELDETFAGHECAHRRRLAEVESECPRCNSAADELGEKGNDNNGNGVCPSFARVEVAEVGLETRESKVNGEEDDKDEILHLFGESDGVAAFVGDHETDEEGAKDGVDANDVGDPSADEDEKEGDHDHDLVGTIFKASGATGEPDEGRLDEEEEDEDPSDGAEENVERGQAGVGIDECYGQSKQDPANDIVSDTCGKHDDADLGVEQLGFGKDTGEHRESSDGHGDTGEENEMTERDIVTVDERVVDSNRDRRTHTEGHDHSGKTDDSGLLGAATNDAHINFETDEEKEEHETKGGDQVEIRQGRRREDVVCEARNATHGGGTEQDTTDDFGNYTRLLDLLKHETEHAGDNDDDGGLDDEKSKRVRSLKVGGVCAANDAVGGAGHEESCRHGCEMCWLVCG